MNRNITNKIFIISLLAIGYIGYNETAIARNTGNDVFNLNEVVVTATRTPKALKDVPAFTRIIRENDIQKTGATNIMQILEYELPGIEFQMHQNQRRVDMQGMKTGAVLFLVDGERIATGEQSNIDYFRFPAEDIERIEIIKGAASALYGSNAVGAVINIITKKAQKPFSLNVSGQYRNTKEMMGHIDIGGKYKYFNFRSSLSSQRLGGYDVYFKQDRPLTLDTTTNISFNQKLGLRYNEKISFNLMGDVYKSKRLFGDPRLGNYFHGYRGNATGVWNINEKGVLTFSASHDYFAKEIFNKKTLDKKKNADDIQQSFRIQYMHNFDKENNFVIGAEYMREMLYNESQVKDRKSACSMSLFAQHDVTLFNKLNLLYGIRADKYTTFGTSFSPKISLMYKWNMFTIRGSYARGFTAPSLKELYTDFLHMGGGFRFQLKGNPDLKPEKSNNFNASIQIVNTKIDFSLMAFYNRFENKIIEKTTRLSSGENMVRWTNAGKITRIKGIETMMKWRIFPFLTWQADYTYSKINNPFELPDGKEVNDVYTRPHILISSLSFAWQKKDWNWYLSCRLKYGSRYQTPDYDSSLQQLTMNDQEAYILLNLNGSITYKKHLTLSCEIGNLTNYKPEIMSFNTPLVNGRSFMMALRYSY